MMTQFSGFKSCIMALILLALWLPTVAQAKLVTFQFTGTVSSIHSGASSASSLALVDPGDSVSGSYTFESTTPGTSGIYYHIHKDMYYFNALYAFDLNIDGSLFSLIATAIGSILVQDNSETAGSAYKKDNYKVLPGGNLQHPKGDRLKADIILSDGLANAGFGTNPDGLSSSALSLIPPNLSLFDVTTRIDVFYQAILALRVNLLTLTRVPNISPNAHAGADNVVLDQATLNASASSDPDGTIVSYQWLLKNRDPTVPSQTVYGLMPTVTNLIKGFYDVTLTVTDDEGAIDTDTMLLTAYGLAYTPAQLNQAVAEAEALKDLEIGDLWQLIGNLNTSMVRMYLCDFDSDGDVDGSNLQHFSQLFGRDWSMQPFSDATFEGAWLAWPVHESLDAAYIIADGMGTLSEIGTFGLQTPAGDYSIAADGQISISVYPVFSADLIPGEGQLTAADSGAVSVFGVADSPEHIVHDLVRVSDPEACLGTWTGSLTEIIETGEEPIIHMVSLEVGLYGAILSATGLTEPVNGRLFSEAGKVAGYIETGEMDADRNFSITGVLNGNTITGQLEVGNGIGFDGTVNLIRE